MRSWLVPLCVVACLLPAAPAAAGTRMADSGTPPAVTPDEIRFSRDTLRVGTARQAGLLPDKVAELRTVAEAYLAPTPDHLNHPSSPGAVVLAARNGIVVQRFAIGDAVRYASPTAELPPEQRIPARVDTLYDLASVSKLFTT
ncbi:hypothetical protein AB0M20_40920, partial [Actinoplanes sp. NPDC051633]